MGRRKHNGCNKLTVPKEPLENMIVNEVSACLSRPENIEIIIAGILEIQKAQNQENTTLLYYQKEQRQNQTAIDNIMKLVESGNATVTTIKRLRELEEIQQSIEQNIKNEKKKLETVLSEENIRKFYKRALKLKPAMLIAYFVEKIVLFDQRMDIYFTTPLPTSPDENQGFSFYSSTVQFGMTDKYFKKRHSIPFGVNIRL